MERPQVLPTPLQRTLRLQGEWLFRWRSYLPVPLIVGLILSEAYAPQGGVWAAWLIPLALPAAVLGVGIRAWVAGHVPGGTSGRGTLAQRADLLNSTGPYSLCRNPLYLGNYFLWISVALFSGSLLWVVGTTLYFWTCYLRIIICEERFLLAEHGEAYAHWADGRLALFPTFRSWRRSNLSWCWRTALKREYSGVMGLVATLAALAFVSQSRLRGRPTLDEAWVLALMATTLLYLLARTLKKRTNFLDVEGR